MKDIDLKTIFIGIFVLAFIFLGYQRMDVGRYELSDGILLDTKTGNAYRDIDLKVDAFDTWHSVRGFKKKN